jgi:hypothetical protein
MRPKRWPASDRSVSLLGPEGLRRGRYVTQSEKEIEGRILDRRKDLLRYLVC